MPMYSMSRAHAHDEIDKLEKQGEEVVIVVPDGASLLVFTRRTGRFVSPMETR